jgi:hypothetical protein
MKISLPNLNNAEQIRKPDRHNRVIRWQNPNMKPTNADSFTVDGGSMDKTRDKMIRQLADIAALSDEDRQQVAVKAYSKMQGMLLGSVEGEYKKQARFKALQGEIAEMETRLRDMGAGEETVNRPRTLNAEEAVKASEENNAFALLENEYAKAKSNLNRLLTPSANKDAYALNNKFRQSHYAYYAAQFEAATGMTSPALDPYNDDDLQVFDRTEANFTDESNKRIDKLLSRSQGLAATMDGYLQKLEDEAENNPGAGISAYHRAVVNHVREILLDYSGKKQ